jgi:hypothetical protein
MRESKEYKLAMESRFTWPQMSSGSVNGAVMRLGNESSSVMVLMEENGDLQETKLCWLDD